MTILIGVKCENGLVIGADSMMSHDESGGSTLANKLKYENNSAVATAGNSALMDNFSDEIMGCIRNSTDSGWILNVEVALRTRLQRTGIAIPPKVGVPFCAFNALIGHGFGNSVRLAYTDSTIGTSEIGNGNEWFKIMGSGENQALPLLRHFIDEYELASEPNVNLGFFLVYRTIKSAIEYSCKGIGYPIDIIIMEYICPNFNISGNPVITTTKYEYCPKMLPNVDKRFVHCDLLIDETKEYMKRHRDDMQADSLPPTFNKNGN